VTLHTDGSGASDGREVRPDKVTKRCLPQRLNPLEVFLWERPCRQKCIFSSASCGLRALGIADETAGLLMQKRIAASGSERAVPSARKRRWSTYRRVRPSVSPTNTSRRKSSGEKVVCGVQLPTSALEASGTRTTTPHVVLARHRKHLGRCALIQYGVNQLDDIHSLRLHDSIGQSRPRVAHRNANALDLALVPELLHSLVPRCLVVPAWAPGMEGVDSQAISP
jgi:hypothetical protein